jgi:signal transduction histidine kinase
MHKSVKILALIQLSFLSTFVNFAQTKNIDLLSRAVLSSESEEKKADLYFELAENLYSYDFEKGLSNAEQSLAIAVKSDYKRGIVQALTSIGTYYYYKGDNEKSRDYYHRALRAIKNSKFDGYPARTYIRLSVLYRQQAYFDSAKIYLDKTYALLEPQMVGPIHASYYASSGVLANDMARNDEALILLRKSLTIRQRSTDTVRIAETWRYIGAVYADRSMYDSAEYCFDQASKLTRRINNPEIQMLLSLARGETNFERGNFSQAIANYQDALDKLKANTYKRYYAYLLYKIGELYENQGAYHTAYDYLFSALKEFESINARQNIARAYSQIGWCYNYQENYTQAIENANKSIEIALIIQDSSSIAQNKNLIGYALLKTKKYPEALTNFEEALVIRKKIKHWWGVSYTLYNIALVKIDQGDQGRALQLLSESLEIDRQIGNKGGYVFACNELGLLHARNRNFDLAANYLKQANEIAKSIPLPTQLITNYKNYIHLFELKNDSKRMIEYYRLYTTLKDSLSNEISSSRIAKADALFQLQKKANEIQLVNKENELNQERINRQQDDIQFQRRVILIITISLLILIALVVIISRLLKSRTKAKNVLRKQNLAILEQQEEIQAQSEELQESNNKLITFNDELKEKNHEIEAQSDKIHEANVNLEKRVEERASQLNIAYNELETFFYRTSHDFRRPLTTYLGLVEVAKGTIKDNQALELFEKVRETTVGLDNMLIKLQSISNIDYEDHLDEFVSGELLNACLERHRTKIESRGIKIIIDGENHSIKANKHLFRTFLENLIENSVEFCTPINPYIRISTSASPASISIIVEDNGQGIPATIQHKIYEMYFRGNDTSKGNGLGLYIAKRAIDKLGGTVTFMSRLNEGTSFKVTSPIGVEFHSYA